MMLSEFPFWIGGLLTLEGMLVAVLIADSLAAQRQQNQQNQDQRLLERLILGTAGETSVRRSWWKRLLR